MKVVTLDHPPNSSLLTQLAPFCHKLAYACPLTTILPPQLRRSIRPIELLSTAGRKPGVRRTRQHIPVDPVDIAGWTAFQKEVGSHPAQWLVSPKEAETEFVLAERDYLFKQSAPRGPSQFWNEVFAHRIGECMGILVPPSYFAKNSLTLEVGVVSESFLEKSLRGTNAFVDGLHLVPTVVHKRNRRVHSFDAISDWITFLERNRLTTEDWREHWSQAFLLDSLLGNTDRHPGNWGAIFAQTNSGRDDVRPVPHFDNGTSMGYELETSRLASILEPSQFQKYVNRGTHQMFWRKTDSRLLSHPEFLRRFVGEFPRYKAGILSRLRIADRTIDTILRKMIEYRGVGALCVERAFLMSRLVKMRRDNLMVVITSA